MQPSRREHESEFQGRVLACLTITLFPLTPQVTVKVSGAFKIVEQKEVLPIFLIKQCLTFKALIFLDI